MVDNVVQAVAFLAGGGKRVSFYAVSKQTGISRSTLYRCDDMRALVVEGRKHSERSVPETGCERSASLEDQLSVLALERDLLLEALSALCEKDARPPHSIALVHF